MKRDTYSELAALLTLIGIVLTLVVGISAMTKIENGSAIAAEKFKDELGPPVIDQWVPPTNDEDGNKAERVALRNE